jgi:hypothetical protein
MRIPRFDKIHERWCTLAPSETTETSFMDVRSVRIFIDMITSRINIAGTIIIIIGRRTLVFMAKCKYLMINMNSMYLI